MPIAYEKNERFPFVIAAERLCADRQPGKCPAAVGCDGTEAGCVVMKQWRAQEVHVEGEEAPRGFVAQSDVTTFWLRTLTWSERAIVIRMIQQGKPQIDYVEYGLRCGLVGWDNFKNLRGEQVVFKATDGKPDPANLEHIDGQYWGVEIFNEIWRVSTLDEVERKN